MIYRFEFAYGARFDDLIEQAPRYRLAIIRSLDDTGFEGHLGWPQRDAQALYLIAEGTGDPDSLGRRLAELADAAGAELTTVGDPPDELAGASAEDRSRAVIEMAIEREVDRCARCNAYPFPPHRGWCPYRLEGGGMGVRPSGADEDLGEGTFEVPARGVVEIT